MNGKGVGLSVLHHTCLDGALDLESSRASVGTSKSMHRVYRGPEIRAGQGDLGT